MKWVTLVFALSLLAGCLGLEGAEPQYAQGTYFLQGSRVTIDVATSSGRMHEGDALEIIATVVNHGPGDVHVDTGGCGLSYDVELRDSRTRSRGVFCTANFVDRTLAPGERLSESWTWDGETYGSNTQGSEYEPGEYLVHAHMTAFAPSEPEWEFQQLRAEVVVELL